MAVPYTIVIAKANIPAGSSSQTVTVPSGHLFIIRDVETRQAPSASNEVYFREIGGTQLIFLTVPSVTNQGHQWQGRVALPAGTSFNVTTVGASAWVWATGYDLQT